MGSRRGATYAKTRPRLQQWAGSKVDQNTTGGPARNLKPDRPHRRVDWMPASYCIHNCRNANSNPEYRPHPPSFRDDTSMPATPHDLFALLDRLGIPHTSVTHPPMFTVEQSQALRGTIPGGHTKNLFLKDKKDAVFLVVAPEDGLVDLKTLHHKLGTARFSFGSADLMLELLGVTPGAVTAFGVINDKAARVNIVLDADLMANAVINCHPLVNTMTTSIGRDDLLKFFTATGHTPRIEPVAGPALPA